ncbi:hypothetical protein AB0942_18555 [Streptomyces nodosus]|uniref:hypothetical protein n=1 Tax=Streptomyces nodosus TaxID=40318 RepID=UPI00345354E1
MRPASGVLRQKAVRATRHPLLRSGTALAEEGDPVLPECSARRMATNFLKSAMPGLASRKHVWVSVVVIPARGCP